MKEAIMYTIPALIVLAATWIVMHKLLKSEQEKRLWELKKASQKEISQVRLRAYERLAILLERTEPEHILTNTDLSGMTIQELQKRLLQTVRLEFDHNMSQQIYVSDELWDKIILARDEMGAFITTIAMQMPQESTALDYAKTMITAYRNNGTTTHQMAIEALKDEARRLLN
jgi:hypothetical protein